MNLKMLASSPDLTILDVGHGQCVVLRDAKGIVVFDAGPGSTLLEFLEDNEITEIDAIIISHADADHLAGLVALLSSATVQVHEVHLNSDATKNSEVWRDLRFAIAGATGEAATHVTIGVTTDSTRNFARGDVEIEILYPSPAVAMAGPGGKDLKGRRLTANSMSVVARISYRSIPRILLTGDIDAVALENLLEDFPSPHSDVLLFPHHGGRPSNADPAKFAASMSQAVQPKVVAFSIGRGKYQTPRDEIVAGIKSILPNVSIACTQLSANCAASVPFSAPNHLASIVAKGRGSHSCCAGSIRLNLENTTIRFDPDLLKHQQFITANASSALCRRVWHGTSV